MACSLPLAVVSGATGGIGSAVVRELAGAGYRVAALGRSAERLLTAEREARAAGLEVSGHLCDPADPAQVSAAAEDLAAAEVLVNNAGMAESAPLAATGLDSWEQHLRVNATSAFLLTRALLPAMAERGSGRIVFVASVAAHTGSKYTAAYTASKHAMLGLARAVAAEVAGTGITSNAVCPAFVRSPMTDRSVAKIVERTGRSRQQAEAALASASPLGRLVEPEEVAAAVAYLAGPRAAAVNGQSLILDGGGIHS